MPKTLTCEERNAIVHENGRYEGWSVHSACTDLDAEYSEFPKMLIVWSKDGRYIKDIRHPNVDTTVRKDRLPCDHYELTEKEANPWMEEEN